MHINIQKSPQLYACSSKCVTNSFDFTLSETGIGISASQEQELKWQKGLKVRSGIFWCQRGRENNCMNVSQRGNNAEVTLKEAPLHCEGRHHSQVQPGLLRAHLASWQSSLSTWIMAIWRGSFEGWRPGFWPARTITIWPSATHSRVRTLYHVVIFGMYQAYSCLLLKMFLCARAPRR